jgi:glycosyltransferase involved in cell wall biosynthesis
LPEGLALERSLSVLLPVRNAESSLSATVRELLEVLPDLTRHFELWIIDDGSSDSTIEVADELATSFPQVRVARHGQPVGRPAAVRTGIEKSGGEILLICGGDHGLPVDQLGRLWRAMDDHEFVVGLPQTIPAPKWGRWRPAPNDPQPAGLHMLHRRAARPFQETLADPGALRRQLAESGCAWQEVEV